MSQPSQFEPPSTHLFVERNHEQTTPQQRNLNSKHDLVMPDFLNEIYYTTAPLPLHNLPAYTLGRLGLRVTLFDLLSASAGASPATLAVGFGPLSIVLGTS